MEILQSIRKKCGVNQQDMATLFGITRDHYAMIETGKRILPAESAQIFAALLPLFLKNIPLPALPEKLPDSLLPENETHLMKAKQKARKAEQAIEACELEISQQQHLCYVLSQIPAMEGLNLTNRAKKLLETLKPADPTALLGKWLLLHTHHQLCQQAVDAYSKLNTRSQS